MKQNIDLLCASIENQIEGKTEFLIVFKNRNEGSVLKDNGQLRIAIYEQRGKTWVEYNGKTLRVSANLIDYIENMEDARDDYFYSENGAVFRTLESKDEFIKRLELFILNL